MVSGMGLVLAFSISKCCGNSVNEKRFSLQRVSVIQLSQIHFQKSTIVACFVQAHCILHVQFVSCLFQKAFDVRFWPCHQKVIDVSTCFLFDAFLTWFETIEQATVVL